jgi:ComF family protein
LLKRHISEKWEINDICFDRVYAYYLYDGVVRNLIHGLKYDSLTKLAPYIAELIYHEHKNLSNYDYIVPVPLHRIKKKERGFNQSELITKFLCIYSGCRYHTNLVKRIRYTETQTLKSHNERMKNLNLAFSLNEKADFKNKKILLIDDVITTGSTINMIAQLLKNKGCKKVDALCFAFANL